MRKKNMNQYSIYVGIRQRRNAATASLSALLFAAIASYPFSVLPFLIVMAFLLAWIHSGKCDSKPASESGDKSSLFRIGKRLHPN
jgi:hypothetical protein